MSLTRTKPAFRSLTVNSSTVGAVVSLIVLVAGLFGLSADPEMLTAAIAAGVTLVTSLLSIWGRLRATATIV